MRTRRRCSRTRSPSSCHSPAFSIDVEGAPKVNHVVRRVSVLASLVLGMTAALVTLAPAASSLTLVDRQPGHRGSSGSARAALATSQLAFVATSHGAAGFVARGPSYAVYFRERSVVVSQTRDGRHGAAIGMRFVRPNPGVRVTADHALRTKVSYLTGARSRWQSALDTFGRVVYRNVWPGIDAVFSGRAERLKYAFVVHPGANPDVIRLAYEGVGRASLSRGGELRLQTPIGVIRDQRPIAFQPRPGGSRVPVDARYKITGANEVSFAVGGHSSTRRLVIDPAIAYATYLGGSVFDGGMAIAVDSNGSAYVTGRSDSANFPSTPGAFAISNAGGGDVFVAKLAPSGGGLVYSTFVGGSAQDEGRGIAVDASGNAYVTGFTYSSNFPTTTAAFDRTYGGNGDGFAVKLNAGGSSLAYSTYLGGSNNDRGLALAIDSAGVSYVTGETSSSNYPTTANSVDPAWNGDFDVFVTAVNATGTALAYSTFLGSGGFDDGLAITVDGASSAYVTGKASPGFPVTPGAFDTTPNGGYDSFVAKLDPAGSRLVYCTYLGGSAWDEGLGIAVDSAGNTYSTGNVQSPNFPTTPGVFDQTLSGSVDAFVTKLNATGSGLVYSTYLGGSDWDEGDGLQIDASGRAYIGGHLGSSNFPTTPDAAQGTKPGGVDAFLTVMDASGSALAYSTYVGSPEWDGGFAIAVDSAGAAYLTGFTSSARFPTTSGAFDRTAGGDYDAFVTKVAMTSPQPPPPPATFTLSASPSIQEVVRGNAVRYDVTITPQNGFTGAIDLSLSGLPPGATASFSPNPAASSSVLTVQTSPSTPPGSATLTISGTHGTTSATTTVRLDIHCCPRPG